MSKLNQSSNLSAYWGILLSRFIASMIVIVGLYIAAMSLLNFFNTSNFSPFEAIESSLASSGEQPIDVAEASPIDVGEADYDMSTSVNNLIAMFQANEVEVYDYGIFERKVLANRDLIAPEVGSNILMESENGYINATEVIVKDGMTQCVIYLDGKLSTDC